jgi:hypothetical protein
MRRYSSTHKNCLVTSEIADAEARAARKGMEQGLSRVDYRFVVTDLAILLKVEL